MQTTAVGLLSSPAMVKHTGGGSNFSHNPVYKRLKVLRISFFSNAARLSGISGKFYGSVLTPEAQISLEFLGYLEQEDTWSSEDSTVYRLY